MTLRHEAVSSGYGHRASGSGARLSTWGFVSGASAVSAPSLISKGPISGDIGLLATCRGGFPACGLVTCANGALLRFPALRSRCLGAGCLGVRRRTPPRYVMRCRRRRAILAPTSR